MRILVAFESDYRAYRGAIARVIRRLRPHVEVTVASLETLGEDVERLDPHLVICSRPNTVDPGGRLAWLELSPITDRPSRICIDGRYRESYNPSLDEILEVIDETEALIGQTREPGSRC